MYFTLLCSTFQTVTVDLVVTQIWRQLAGLNPTLVIGSEVNFTDVSFLPVV